MFIRNLLTLFFIIVIGSLLIYFTENSTTEGIITNTRTNPVQDSVFLSDLQLTINGNNLGMIQSIENWRSILAAPVRFPDENTALVDEGYFSFSGLTKRDTLFRLTTVSTFTNPNRKIELVKENIRFHCNMSQEYFEHRFRRSRLHRTVKAIGNAFEFTYCIYNSDTTSVIKRLVINYYFNRLSRITIGYRN